MVLLPLLWGPIRIQNRLYVMFAVLTIGPTFVIVKCLILNGRWKRLDGRCGWMEEGKWKREDVEGGDGRRMRGGRNSEIILENY
jgi:hypothetical protein